MACILFYQSTNCLIFDGLQIVVLRRVTLDVAEDCFFVLVAFDRSAFSYATIICGPLMVLKRYVLVIWIVYSWLPKKLETRKSKKETDDDNAVIKYDNATK